MPIEKVFLASTIANTLAASSALITSQGKPHLGSPIAVFASLAFSVYAYVSDQPEFYVSNAIFLSIHLRGTWNWTVKKRYRVMKH